MIKYVGSSRVADMRAAMEVVLSLNGIELPDRVVDHMIAAGRGVNGPLSDEIAKGSIEIPVLDVRKAIRKVQKVHGNEALLSHAAVHALLLELGVQVPGGDTSPERRIPGVL